MSPAQAVASSTTALTPAGLRGYAKAIIAAVSAALIAVLPVLPVGSLQSYLSVGAAILGAVGVLLVPNAIAPVVLLPPAVLDVVPPDDEAESP